MTCACPVCGSAIDEMPVTFYPERGMVIAGGRFTVLTGKEMVLLEALCRSFPKGLTKAQLMDACYSGMDEPALKIVDVFICKIRKKVEPLGVRIDTIWGKGYALAIDKKPVMIAGFGD